MCRRIVKWNGVAGKNVRGEDTLFAMPNLLDSSTEWTLIDRILRMERKNPITFTNAVSMVIEKYMEARSTHGLGSKPGHAHWYTDNFIDWISSLDFHIELTGDEFELYDAGVPTA